MLLLRPDDRVPVDERMAAVLTDERLEQVLNAVPEELLMDQLARGDFASVDEARERYVRYLSDRLRPPRLFAGEIERARTARKSEPARRLGTRR